MFGLGLGAIPILVFLIYPCTFITTYLIAGGSGHVSWVFPYISDTGAKVPESCIFAQLLNIAAFLTFFLMYLRFLQIKELHSRCKFPASVQKLNSYSIWIGALSALGTSMVGNFQETSIIWAHLIGALMAFGFGIVYLFMHTSIAYKTSPITCSRIVCHLRLVCSMICTVFFFTTFLFAWLSIAERGDPIEDRLIWTPDHPGYGFHLASSLSEWLMLAVFTTYLITFYKEFNQMEIREPNVSIRISDDRLTQITPPLREHTVH